MRVIYGRGSDRIELTSSGMELNWSSSRGQLSQVCNIRIINSPALVSAGFLMLFEGGLEEKYQIFHGPIIRPERNDKTGEMSTTAYEISWYLQKNDVSRMKLSGDAGKELERLIRARGVNFTCPSLGFTLKDRISAQSYASLFTSIMQQAYDKTGKRYFLQHTRDKLEVMREGSNRLIPVFHPFAILDSSTGESIEPVYTVVRVERYKDDKVVGSVTKEDANLIKKIGRMEKIIDAGEDKDLSGLANRQLANLSKVPKTRSISVMHNDPGAAKLRAGWLIKIAEKDGKITDWIVTACSARWRSQKYAMDLELESR